LLLSARRLSPLLLLLPACSAPTTPSGSGGAAGAGGGDSGPLVVQAIEYDQYTQQFRVLSDGDTVQLVRPPQGGHVIFIGARVQNLDSDTIDLTGRIRDEQTNSIVQEDTRTVVTETVPDMPGWRQSDHRSFSQVSNIALCPDYDPKDILGQSYLLEVRVDELYAQGSSGSVSLHVVPACSQDNASGKSLCECECSADYTLGKCSGSSPTNDAGP
jgi:hypothetical protein